MIIEGKKDGCGEFSRLVDSREFCIGEGKGMSEISEQAMGDCIGILIDFENKGIRASDAVLKVASIIGGDERYLSDLKAAYAKAQDENSALRKRCEEYEAGLREISSEMTLAGVGALEDFHGVLSQEGLVNLIFTKMIAEAPLDKLTIPEWDGIRRIEEAS